MFILYIFLYPLLFLFIIFILLFLYLNRNHNYWKKRNIPYIKPKLCLGNTGSILFLKTSIWEGIAELHRSTDEPYIGIFTLDKPALVMRDKQLIKQIFIKDFDYFMDRSFAPIEELEPFAANGIFGMKGEKWRKLRARLTPVFTSGKIKNMFYIVREQTERLDKQLQKFVDNQVNFFNPKAILSCYSTDVVTSCSFGLEANSMENPDAEFRRIGKSIMEQNTWEAFKTRLMFIAPWVLRTFKLALEDFNTYDYMRNAIWSTVEYRKKNGVYRHDFVDLLVELRARTWEEKKTDPSVLALDGDVLVAQAFGFLIAGFETSSHTLSMTLYELALHPDIQEKARKEVRSVLAKYNNELTYDGLKEMKYLRQCIDETLRKYPPLSFLDRICSKNYQIPGTDHIIEAGTVVFISVSELHNDPDVFPNPDKYDPDRFRSDLIPNYKLNYYPFGEGPRICIGIRFAIIQMMLPLAHLLNKYSVEPCADTPIPLEFDVKQFNLTVRGGFPLSLKTCPEY